MIGERELGQVTDLMLVVACDEVLPRFGALSDADVTEKGPGDLVTIADRRAEERLTEGLTALLPGSHVVGEEAVHADAGILRQLDGDRPVWIVDPVDGTGNFVRGDERYCMLVALASGGKVQASWTYAPSLGLLATARLGGGALYNGRPVRVPGAPEPGAEAEPGTKSTDANAGESATATSGTAGAKSARSAKGSRGKSAGARRGSAKPAAAKSGGAAAQAARRRLRLTHPTYLRPEHKDMLAKLRTPEFEVEPSTSAGLEYVDLVRGEADALVYTWENPWDHAAGLLLLSEAGGMSANLDGSPFALTGGNALPLIAAANEDLTTDLTKRLTA
ncbi:inositol monophosphatase family protein [Yinghuangia sp. YIM S09857]|uniref:inositol monophosphatase family protein n=1 Tax=Yinghuangia sp. YIM S09857 TaxID=3436929 RepID=UPI003F52B610